MSLTQINKAGLDEIALDHVFTIGASGSSAYTFQGEGLNGTVNNPTLYLTRGKTYRFENGSGGHPIRIQSTSGASGTAYNTGVTNNAGSGTVIVEVQHDAPDVLYYQCTSHAAMNGILYITGALADGGVTTAKIAAGAVTEAKLATNAVTTDKINSGVITNAKLAANAVGTANIADNAVTTAKIPDDGITTAKIADANVTTDSIADGSINAGKLANNAVTTSKILDEAVSLSKLEHGTSSNDGKFLRANNGADPTFETVSAGPTINNQADHRLITCTGTADTLNGESTLTFDNSNNILISGSGYAIANIGGHISGSGGGQDYISIKDSAGTERFVVKTHGTNNGKVGIGMTNPDDTLDVNGTFHASGNAYVGGTLYALGNDIRIGGTGTGNSLDDYEEGAFYPQVHTQNGHTNATYHYQQGWYTKIGRMVYAHFYIHWSGASNHNGYIYFNNFPFTSANISHNNSVGSVMLHSATFPSGYTDAVLYMGSNTTGTNLYYSKSGSGWAAGQNTNAGEIIASITYTST